MLLSRERKNEKLRARILLFVLFIKRLAIGARVVYSIYKDFAKKLHFCVKEPNDETNLVAVCRAGAAVACFGGALGMAHSVAKAANNMAEQPEAAGQIRTSMMMGLVFIETVIIYALIVAILIIFVL